MNILVTGGAGYIGSVLVPFLLSKGHHVTVIDDFRYNQASLLDVCHNPHLTLARGDARDQNLVAAHMKGKDFIIPLACLVGAPLCDLYPDEAKSINLAAVKMLLKLRDKNQKMIYPNTNSGYGIGEKNSFCTEETPLRPISLYGKTKVAAEKALLESGNSIALRLATVFGVSPRMRLDLLVNDFVHRAVNDRAIVLFEADFKRNYIHVRDVARAVVHSMENFDRMKNHAYNLGLSDANLSKRELCEEIKKQVSSLYYVEAATGEDPDKRNYIVSNEKIEKTGFWPQVSLQDGIRELIKGYQIIRRNQFSNV
ncbi:MAG: NAD-dependent epimerase/dehydratase [Parcubacteria group bacterium Gr01-1014_66]|nr:MAG: NAD-dependent epimerase/dehydratase [Parcubacteria group bacterium Gr01-1014_66]